MHCKLKKKALTPSKSAMEANASLSEPDDSCAAAVPSMDAIDIVAVVWHARSYWYDAQ